MWLPRLTPQRFHVAERKKAELLERLAEDVSYCDDTIKDAFNESKCTFSRTQESYTRQPWFACDDCPSGFQMCASCVKVCHGPEGRFTDHKISEYYSTADMYCDCWHGDNGDVSLSRFKLCSSIRTDRQLFEVRMSRRDPGEQWCEKSVGRSR